MWPHTVAILIGGQSTRMGSPKHVVTLPNGKTMLQSMLGFAEQTACKTVLVGGTIPGHKCILDNRTLQGPVAGIEALLASGVDSEYLVVGCDMPLLEKIHIQPLLNCRTNASFTHEGFTLGLPIRIYANTLSSCSTYLEAGNKSIRGFVQSIPHCAIPITESHLHCITSMNTKEDIRGAYST